LLYEKKFHNHFFFIKDYIMKKMVNCILVDDGSVVSILPLKTMKELRIPSYMMIQGLNQGWENIIKKIRLIIHMEDMKSNALFHVLNAKTIYNMLLGWLWIHENGIISLTLYRFFKYCQNGQMRKILTNIDPFTIVEAHFASATFCFELAIMKELSSPNHQE